MPDVSFVIAVDKAHAEQLRIVAPVWRINAPEIWRHPLRIIFDHDSFTQDDLDLLGNVIDHDDCAFHAWPSVEFPPMNREYPGYATQREKMLTAFVCLAPRLVSTTWWFKIDTDAIPVMRDARWLSDVWFAPLDDWTLPCFVAPHWGYSHVPKGGSPMTFDDWGDSHPAISRFPRTGITHTPDTKRVPHRRMCSWLSFYRTDWSLWAAELFRQQKLPIPSQDGVHSLLAARCGHRWRHYPAKRLGWCNFPRVDRLRDESQRILAAKSQEVAR